MGSWFEVYPYWETIGAQLLAILLVAGSYVVAERLRQPPKAGHRRSARPTPSPRPSSPERLPRR